MNIIPSLIGFSLLGLMACPAETEEGPADESKLTLSRIFTQRDFNEEKMETICWSKRNASYFAMEKASKGKAGKDLVRIEAATGEKSIIATASELTPAGQTQPLPIEGFEMSHDEALVLLFTNAKKSWRSKTLGDYWLLDLKSMQLRKIGGDARPSSLMFAKFSPDATRVAFVQDHNLYVQRLSDLAITPLTNDGSESVLNGVPDWVNEEELRLRDCFRWSPDGERILFWQFDTTGVQQITLVAETDSKAETSRTFPYPTAGTKNSAVRLGVVDVNDRVVRWMDIPGEPREHYLPRAEWTLSGTALVALQFNRLQNTLKVFRSDPVTGATRLILTDTDKAWIENKNKLDWVNESFVFISEKSGWRHAYLSSPEGRLSPITSGDYDLIDIVKVDPKGGWLYYLASPDNATQRYLYRASLKGGASERLTPADLPGTHEYNISEDADWAIHSYSRMTQPPVISLVSLERHQTVRVLKEQKSLLEKLRKIEMPKSEFLRLDIGGGIVLDAWMITPRDLDPSRKYPLITHVYGEPLGQTVKDAWNGQRNLWHWMLAQQGYVVVAAESRGSNSPRGRDWRKASYGQLSILPSQEQAAAVRALLARFPFLESGKVGIWGWSGGGTSSLDAIFRYPDLYQAAISVAPVTDRLLYNTIYEERFMGLPQENKEAYRLGSPITHAASLKGDLLLVHGTGDDNVHYRNTEKLMNELIAKGKSFAIMPYPGRDHSINTGKGISRHLYGLMTDFLHQNLPPQ